MLCVDKRCDATGALGVGDGVECEGCFTRGLRTVDLYDAAAGKPAYAEGDVQCNGTRRDDLDGGAVIAPETHNGALAKLAIDLGECGFE